MSAGGAASAAAPGAREPAAAWLADPRLPLVLLRGRGRRLGGVLLVVLSSRLTFFIDDWDVLLHRRGLSADVFLRAARRAPGDGHRRALQGDPGHVRDGLAHPVRDRLDARLRWSAGSLLFVWMRSRVGAWLALAGVLPLLFLRRRLRGPPGPVPGRLLRPGGLRSRRAAGARARAPARSGALLRAAGRWAQLPDDRARVRRRRRGRARASTASCAAAGWVPVDPRRPVRALVPRLGHSGSHQFTFDNLATAPAFVLDGFSAAVSSLLGFATPDDGALAWGRALLAVLVVLAAARLLTPAHASRGRVGGARDRGRLLGADRATTRATSAAPRPRATSTWGWCSCSCSPPRSGAARDRAGPSSGWRCSASLAAVGGNLVALRDANRDLLNLTPVVRGDLAGLEIAADRVDPALVLDRANSGFNYFTLLDAGSYLSAAEKFGSPAYDQAELATAPESGALGRRPRHGGGARAAPGAGSRPRRPTTATRSTLRARSCRSRRGRPCLRQRGPAAAKIDLRRYATESSPVELGRLGPGAGCGARDPDRSLAAAVAARGRRRGLELCAPSPSGPAYSTSGLATGWAATRGASSSSGRT